MRSGGVNWLAVLVAAIAVYAIGFVIYGLLIPEEAMSGMTDAEKSIAASRMAFGPLMPILTAVFMAVVFKWATVDSVSDGVKWAVVIALASAIPTMLYGWVYGGLPTDTTLIDCAHLLAGHIAAGAILGGWK